MWNKVRFANKVILARLFNKNIPLCVGVHLTNRCNFNCIYCYGSYGTRNLPEFTTPQVFDLIDELEEMGTIWITLTGGEPLIREDIVPIIDRIKNKRMICSMNTNASLITQKLEAVKKLDFITVSLDGDETANDMNRGRGTFKRIMEGIECLTNNRIPFDVVAVLTKFNMGSIDALLDLAKKFGFPLEFNFLQDQNVSHQDQSSFSLQDKEIKYILRKIINLKKKGWPIYYASSSREYSLRWPLSYTKKIIYEDVAGFKPIVCYMGSLMCHIDSDGKVYPCIQLLGRFPALSFLECGFRKAWENLKDKKECKACYAVCYAEFNKFFGLAPDVWVNSIWQIIKNKRKRG